jgi:hypothetical protein
MAGLVVGVVPRLQNDGTHGVARVVIKLNDRVAVSESQAVLLQTGGQSLGL